MQAGTLEWSAMAKTNLLPYRVFVKLVKEISSEASAVGLTLHWEKDAIVALQMMTEQVLVMIFEMM